MFDRNVSLKKYCTLQVGGPAEFFTSVNTEATLAAALLEVAERPWRVIGGGSNVLVPDEGLLGVTIKNSISGFTELKEGESIFVTVGAGEEFDETVARCVAAGYWGLENLSHIPGSVGATPVQNVGAYGTEVAHVIESVRVYDTKQGEFVTLSNEACQFGYRDSIFKHEAGAQYIVTEVTFKLSLIPTPLLEYRDLATYFATQEQHSLPEIRAAVIQIRGKKFPDWKVVGTAGSFFKNPIVPRAVFEKLRDAYPGLPGYDVSDHEVKIPLGWILDKICNLRGYEVGNVGTYQGQALVIINKGQATATEITQFADFIIKKVLEKTGIEVEWEVTKLK